MYRQLGLILSAILLLLSIQIATPAVAQEQFEICGPGAAAQQQSAGQRFLSTLERLVQYKIAPGAPIPLPNATPIPGLPTLRALPPQKATAPVETRESYWAYRHKELHDRGIVDQILKNANSDCCGGTDSGECRVSSLDEIHHLVMVDGKWCPYNSNTHVVAVDGLDDDEEAVVCAGKTNRTLTGGPECPATYCIATAARL
jgi:hypothetical protein